MEGANKEILRCGCGDLVTLELLRAPKFMCPCGRWLVVGADNFLHKLPQG